MIRYYAELNRSQVESLVEIFHLDLLLFGYNAQVTPSTLISNISQGSSSCGYILLQTMILISICILGVLGPCQRKSPGALRTPPSS